MSEIKTKNIYDDDDIPEADLPQDTNRSSDQEDYTSAEPLPESSRPRKDGPGGN